MTICSTSHPEDGVSKLPDRVIELSLDTSHQIRLIDTGNRKERYACLSHCWGDQQPLRTTQVPDTISAHRQNIRVENLPRTFQDAITVTMAIGIQYIWIDSLCIIQDDEDDWQAQSAQMANIYANSTITIAASASSNPHEGLFRIADNKYLSQPLASAGHVRVRQKLSHSVFDLPLLQQGWVFQERLLSPRILHFANHELIWECMECTDCECRGIDVEPSVKIDPWPVSKNQCVPAEWRSLRDDSLKISDMWRNLAKEYSVLKLSKSNDIFPAISGIAKSFGEATGWQYVAGMWKEKIINHLSWLAFQPGTRCLPWRAPTFSWASINPVDDRHNEDPTGQLESGYIILSGTVIQMAIDPVYRPWEGYRVRSLPFDEKPAAFFFFNPDVFLSQAGHEVVDDEAVFCLELLRGKFSENDQVAYLVLLKRKLIPWEYKGMRGDCEFERIGLMKYHIVGAYHWMTLKEASPDYAIQHNATVKIV